MLSVSTTNSRLSRFEQDGFCSSRSSTSIPDLQCSSARLRQKFTTTVQIIARTADIISTLYDTSTDALLYRDVGHDEEDHSSRRISCPLVWFDTGSLCFDSYRCDLFYILHESKTVAGLQRTKSESNPTGHRW